MKPLRIVASVRKKKKQQLRSIVTLQLNIQAIRVVSFLEYITYLLVYIYTAFTYTYIRMLMLIPIHPYSILVYIAYIYFEC